MAKKKRPWNKGKIIGRKKPLTPEQVATIRTLLSQKGNVRNTALFGVAIDSSLRGVDLMALNVSDVLDGFEIKERVTVEQSKTKGRVSFGLRDYTREALKEWIDAADKAYGEPLFTSLKGNKGYRLSVDHYQHLVKQWISMAQLDIAQYGSHSLRRTRVAQVLLGHKNIESTTRYLGIEEEEAMDIAKQFEI